MPKFIDDERVDSKVTRDDLKERVAVARNVRQLLDSQAGKDLIKHLKDQYKLYLYAAINSSQQYKSACKSIEETLFFLGTQISAGDAAEEMLEDLLNGKVDADY